MPIPGEEEYDIKPFVKEEIKSEYEFEEKPNIDGQSLLPGCNIDKKGLDEKAVSSQVKECVFPLPINVKCLFANQKEVSGSASTRWMKHNVSSAPAREEQTKFKQNGSAESLNSKQNFVSQPLVPQKSSTTSCRKTPSEENFVHPFMKPFLQGWHRKIIKRQTRSGNKERSDVYYVSPGGKILRSSPEVDRFLKKHTSTLCAFSNFTFNSKPLGGIFSRHETCGVSQTVRNKNSKSKLMKQSTSAPNHHVEFSISQKKNDCSSALAKGKTEQNHNADSKRNSVSQPSVSLTSSVIGGSQIAPSSKKNFVHPFMKPFLKGWHREIIRARSLASSGKVRNYINYISPSGKRLQSFQVLQTFLKENSSDLSAISNFTFKPEPLGGIFSQHETYRMSQPGGKNHLKRKIIMLPKSVQNTHVDMPIIQSENNCSAALSKEEIEQNCNAENNSKHHLVSQPSVFLVSRIIGESSITTPSEKKCHPLMKPFLLGWRREIILQQSLNPDRKVVTHVLYISPNGRTCRSLSDISKFLTKKNSNLSSFSNFTFKPEPLGGIFSQYETCRVSQADRSDIRQSKIMKLPESVVIDNRCVTTNSNDSNALSKPKVSEKAKNMKRNGSRNFLKHNVALLHEPIQNGVPTATNNICALDQKVCGTSVNRKLNIPKLKEGLINDGVQMKKGETPRISGRDSNKALCICSNASNDSMILCAYENCVIGWYHVTCVSLPDIPYTLGPWFCPICQGSDCSVLNNTYVSEIMRS